MQPDELDMRFRTVPLVLIELVERIRLRELHHHAVARHFRGDGSEHDSWHDAVATYYRLLFVLGRSL